MLLEKAMKRRIIDPRTLLCALLISAGAIATAHTAQTPDTEPNEKRLECELKFNLNGRPAFYETANGAGIITCNNGQRAKLNIRTSGGGTTFGDSEVVDGTGRFSDARTIDELFGSYVHSVVLARVSESAAVQVLTKGRISLVLSGTSRGMDFGFAFEKFTIEPAGFGHAFTWATVDTDRD